MEWIVGMLMTAAGIVVSAHVFANPIGGNWLARVPANSVISSVQHFSTYALKVRAS